MSLSNPILENVDQHVCAMLYPCLCSIIKPPTLPKTTPKKKAGERKVSVEKAEADNSKPGEISKMETRL